MARYHVAAAVLCDATRWHRGPIIEWQRAGSPQRNLCVFCLRQSSLQDGLKVRLRHRLAKLLAADSPRSCARTQHDLSDLRQGNFVRTLRLAFGTYLQGRTAPDWVALLHERGRAHVS